MDPMNREQVKFQLSNALVDIFSRYVIYDGQVEKFASTEADTLAKRFESFLDQELLKRSR